MNTTFWFRNMNARDNLEDLGIDGEIILEWMDLREMGWEGVD